ncbi:hypothetical protein TNIN_130661 [Trichonephila inaurata madagascariensis]|uniref:Uncharacterized protein n=1 Tax=Trichonephila inaurata madagascariensis TaxID=2747483 RepID=A0A8X7BRF3_9ARAC|nr:hypothetical protein TNIN_130661 [Trichonephila inaurata madagascariensis]
MFPATSSDRLTGPAAPAAGSVAAPGSSKEDDGFTVVSRKGRRIAPIVIDSQRNATELLVSWGKVLRYTTGGRYENETPSFSPVSAKRAPLTQKYISDIWSGIYNG